MHINPPRKERKLTQRKQHRKNRKRNYINTINTPIQPNLKHDIQDDKAIEIIFNRKKTTLFTYINLTTIQEFRALFDFRFERNGNVTKCIFYRKVQCYKRPKYRYIVEHKYQNLVGVAVFKNGILEEVQYPLKEGCSDAFLKYERKCYQFCTVNYTAGDNTINVYGGHKPNNNIRFFKNGYPGYDYRYVIRYP